MTMLAARLGRAVAALSAKERAILVLRAHNQGSDEDPAVRDSMPAEQAGEFKRYLALIFAANLEMGALCYVIAGHAERLSRAFATVETLHEAAGMLSEDLGEPLEANVRGWRSRENVTVPTFLKGLAEDLRRDLAPDLHLRRREAQELKVVWDEIAAEFEGEDAADPELRARLLQAEAGLEALAAKAGRAAKRPPAPDPGGLERVRSLIDRAFNLLGLDEKPQERKTWERPS